MNGLRAKLLCNCGLYLQYGSSAILVDALNQPFRSFQDIPDDTAGQLIRALPPYEQIDGIFYTHLHPDHYEETRNRTFLEHHPGIPHFFPRPETSEQGRIEAGAFTVEYRHLEHIPCDHAWVKHYVLLIFAGDVTVYLTADALPDPAAHREVLAGRRADHGFFNALWLSFPETRAFLQEGVGKSYIYHMPPLASDGICRKASRNLARFPGELHGVTVLDRYPYDIELPPVS